MMPAFNSILTQFPKPHVIKPKDEPQIAPKPRSTIAPKRPESSPTKPPEVAPGQIKDKDGNVVIIQDSNNTGMTNNTFSDDPFTSTNEDESPNDVLNPEMGLYGPLGEDEFKTRGYDNIGSAVASSEGGGYGKKRKAEMSRGQMNLTGSKGSTILTS